MEKFLDAVMNNSGRTEILSMQYMYLTFTMQSMQSNQDFIKENYGMDALLSTREPAF